MKKISVIIPSFNAVGLLQKNLKSVLDALSTNDQVIIVDDAGSDETVNWLCKKYNLEEITPQLEKTNSKYFPKLTSNDYICFENDIVHNQTKVNITLLKLKQNLRFAGAVNAGVLVSKNSLLFLCNNDVLPDKKCFEFLKPHFDDEEVFAVGCLEYENSEMGQRSGKNVLFFDRGLFQHNRANNFERGQTAWASGGSALFDKKKWLKLNGFDQAFYPAYWEDIDLSFRARKKGWKILFEPEAVVYHKHESTHQTVFGQQKMDDMSWKNAFVFTWKNGTRVQRLQYILWSSYWWYKRLRATR